MGKPIEGDEAVELLTEAYALLRQSLFIMAQTSDIPQGSEEVSAAVEEFCDKYEGRLFPKQEGPKNAPCEGEPKTEVLG